MGLAVTILVTNVVFVAYYARIYECLSVILLILQRKAVLIAAGFLEKIPVVNPLKVLYNNQVVKIFKLLRSSFYDESK